MKKILYPILFLAALLSSCSEIAEEDRLSYYDPSVEGTPEEPVAPGDIEGLVAVTRNILIEDFTGQKCKNCPEGAAILENIVSTYGEGQVIPVAIHCGPFGFDGNASYAGLKTDLGQAYWSRWFNDQQPQPVAKINRGVANDNYDEWPIEVAAAAKKTTYISWKINTEYNEGTRTLGITTQAVAPEGTKGYYQLWLVEDGFVGLQLMPNGSTNTTYVHNHILRASINGVWGEEVTWGKVATQLTHSFTLDAGYQAKNCYIVAFLYDESGVRQASKTSIAQ